MFNSRRVFGSHVGWSKKGTIEKKQNIMNKKSQKSILNLLMALLSNGNGRWVLRIGKWSSFSNFSSFFSSNVGRFGKSASLSSSLQRLCETKMVCIPRCSAQVQLFLQRFVYMKLYVWNCLNMYCTSMKMHHLSLILFSNAFQIIFLQHSSRPDLSNLQKKHNTF